MLTKFEWTNEHLVELLQYQHDFAHGHPHEYVIGSFIHDKMKQMGRTPPKPLFKTMDGIDIYEGGKYWFVKAHDENNIHFNPVASHVPRNSGNKRFSTEEKAQEYLDCYKVIFTTDDGVEMRIGNKCWLLNQGDGHLTTCTVNAGIFVKAAGFKYFSTREAAENYIDQHQPIFSVHHLQEFLNDFYKGRVAMFTAADFYNYIIKQKP